MRRRGLRALQPKAFTPRTTDSTHGLRCAPNRLLDQPKPTQANRVWVSDITYLPLANGDWAYLCAFQDMASKQVVGWQVGATMPEELVTSALQRAFWAQPSTPSLLVHSDRGGQYCGNAYRQLLHGHQALRSQSRRGECYDNALPGTTQAGSLWSRLETEELERREWPVLRTWPMRRPVRPLILTTTIMTGCTPVSAIRPRTTLINNFFKPLPQTVQPNRTTSTSRLLGNPNEWARK